jgi:nucleoside-diphosphate-sugar epimerase
MSVQQVQSRGIYHGLPVYPPDLKDLTAIVTGANGISGHYMVRVLSQAPERWTKIYCLSRRPPLIPGGLPPNAEHIAVDFLKDPAEIAAKLKARNVPRFADDRVYVFFFSYIQAEPKTNAGLWSDALEMCRVNSLLLDNFLAALVKAEIEPERFMLQTGAKNYGVHLGPTKLPQEESDPRVTLEPNFYYPQEDSLFKYCREQSPSTRWNILMPGPILGAVPDAAMNGAFPLAVYAAVCRHRGLPLEFPADVASWQMHQSTSSAMMNAYMEEWAVLTPAAADQKFNACDNSAFTWEACWPRVAGWYGIGWIGPEPDPEAKYIETKTRFNPRGYGEKGISRRKFTFVDWAKGKDVAAAWKEIADQNGLSPNELKDVDRVFGFLDGMVCRPAPLIFRYERDHPSPCCLPFPFLPHK